MPDQEVHNVMTILTFMTVGYFVVMMIMYRSKLHVLSIMACGAGIASLIIMWLMTFTIVPQ